MRRIFLASAMVLLCVGAQASSEPPRYSVQLMTPETAVRAAQAALASCRAQGYQVSVAVVDRSGLLQVLVRDRFAGAHTPTVAQDKAWTAASFKMSTTALARETQAGQAMSGIRHSPRVLAIGGGLTIEAGGNLFGAIGVSGAPGGDADDRCAKAGIDAVIADLEL